MQGEKRSGKLQRNAGDQIMAEFKLESPYQPTGDQPQAIEKLTEGVLDGIRTQVLVGVTGSGKTFTMASYARHRAQQNTRGTTLQ